MKPSNADFPLSDSTCGFDSHDCQIIIIDGPGDTTVRPPTPEVLQWYQAKRERLAKLGFNLDGTPIQSPDDTAAK